MPITMQHEQDNIYRLEISGMLQKNEFDRVAGLAGRGDEADRRGQTAVRAVELRRAGSGLRTGAISRST